MRARKTAELIDHELRDGHPLFQSKHLEKVQSLLREAQRSTIKESIKKNGGELLGRYKEKAERNAQFSESVDSYQLTLDKNGASTLSAKITLRKTDRYFEVAQACGNGLEIDVYVEDSSQSYYPRAASLSISPLCVIRSAEIASFKKDEQSQVPSIEYFVKLNGSELTISPFSN